MILIANLNNKRASSGVSSVDHGREYTIFCGKIKVTQCLCPGLPPFFRQPPPGSARIFVVLPVITEMKTGEKRQPNRIIIAFGVVRIVVPALWFAVR